MIKSIKEDVERISVLTELCEDLIKRETPSEENENEIQLRINIAKEEILKSTYNIKRILTKIENSL